MVWRTTFVAPMQCFLKAFSTVHFYGPPETCNSNHLLSKAAFVPVTSPTPQLFFEKLFSQQIFLLGFHDQTVMVIESCPTF